MKLGFKEIIIGGLFLSLVFAIPISFSVSFFLTLQMPGRFQDEESQITLAASNYYNQSYLPTLLNYLKGQWGFSWVYPDRSVLSDSYISLDWHRHHRRNILSVNWSNRFLPQILYRTNFQSVISHRQFGGVPPQIHNYLFLNCIKWYHWMTIVISNGPKINP